MSNSSQSEITRILAHLQEPGVDGRPESDRLFDLAYDELRGMASNFMRGERDGHTLQPTALVHEAYLRLVLPDKINWQGRAHFFGIAARAMRQILIHHARRRAAAKREGGWEQVTLEHIIDSGTVSDEKLLRFDELLIQLREMDERMARVIELRVFAGMEIKEIAHVLEVSPRTIDNDWSVGKKWISRELASGSPS